ncbi:MAG: YdcF family protein [Clostridia bacterium]|nr:YdcF family protein [Clostridia bacterium]
MKIYTLKRKPNLFGFLFFSLACFAAAGILWLLPDRSGVWGAGNLAVFLAVYFFSAVLILVFTLIRQMRYNPYSYNTIYYFGFALFFLSLCISQTVAACRCIAGAGSFGLPEAAALTVASAKNYMRLSLPFLLLFSAALAVSNVRLMQREGVRAQNVLALALAVFLLGGEAVIFLLGSAGGALGFAVGLFSFLYLYIECMIVGAIFADVFAALHEPAYDKDRIVILGCRVARDGQPTPLLRQRADAALAFARRQLDATGKKATFLPSGGKGADEPVSEAACVRDYLIRRGVDPGDITLEDRSVNTLENMRFSFEKTAKNEKCAFATSDYHVFRSGIWANRACKFKAEGVGAPTKWYFWPNAAVREFAGLLTGHRGKQLLILASLIAFYLLSYLVTAKG